MASRGEPTIQQLPLDLGRGDDIEVYLLDEATEHGEVFTRRWVVELILDLVGYTSDRDLGAMVAVEPSCGSGAFLVPMTERFIAACHRHGTPLTAIGDALRAYDLLPGNVELARKAVATVLVDEGVDDLTADTLAAQCVRPADFLLSPSDNDRVDFVVGNPPYIRLEDIPARRRAQYRRACPTMRGRADIFVGFIERGLRMLGTGGALGFIVADRWMHNQYGADLRRLIADGYSVDTVLSMHDVDAFEARVSAYPAITVIRREVPTTPVVASASASFDERAAATFTQWVRSASTRRSTTAVTATRLPRWFDSATSWPSGNPANLALLSDLEQRFSPLENPATATRVGIGVATGNDSIYLSDDADLVEPERLLPILTTRDTVNGVAEWSGTYLVNPWEDGKLVSLRDYPRFARYLEDRQAEIKGRHVAQKNPDRWYRTIDRVDPTLCERPKLVIPDLKAHLHPVLDRGETYPHHSFYVVTSDTWDLEALGGLLLSDIAELFVAMYCVRMRGGCYRFQAQYLRRIRVPDPATIGTRDQAALRDAFAKRDRVHASSLARQLYGLPAETAVLAS